ncbi:MAG: GNAT family N-acetyltransferase [Gammaproteobacteria bacterium]
MDDLLIVRPATHADCEDIYRVHVDAVRGLPAGTQGKDGIEKWLKTREPAVYADEMQKELLVVAEEDGELLGWGAFCSNKKEITNVFVDPVHHRRGVGTAIVTVLEDAARQGGLDSVQLQATGTAIEFYLAIGFQSDPPVQPGAEWALMKKAL